MVPPHLMVRLSGDLFGGPQSWSVGFRFRSATGGDPAAAGGIQGKLEDWRDAIRTLNANQILPPDLWTSIGGAVRIQTIRTALIGADGKEQAVAVVDGAPLAIGNDAALHPSQVAICATLTTDKPGASNRGRVYWPGLSRSIDGTGRMDAGISARLATATAGFIHDLAGAGADPANPQLLPVVISGTKNTATAITGVRVGSRLDIQRRRADKEKEIYAVAVVPQ